MIHIIREVFPESIWVFYYSEQTIAMTVPVSTKVEIDPAGKDTDNNREMGFYIGKEHQDTPPEPSNQSVFIVERKPMTVYTRLEIFSQISF